jgi:hypothetical protein
LRVMAPKAQLASQTPQPIHKVVSTMSMEVLLKSYVTN